MIGELYINGLDAFLTWGVGMEDKGVSALMTPAPQKEIISNTSRLEHGKRVITKNPKKDSRDVTLPMHIYADTKAEFFAKYNAFCVELEKGRLIIESQYIPNTSYRMDYQSCTQYAQYNGTMGIFSLKLNEPNPKDRGKTAL